MFAINLNKSDPRINKKNPRNLMVVLFNTPSYNYYESLGVSIGRWLRWGQIPNHTECKFSALGFFCQV